MRDLLAASGRLFDRGLPVRVVRLADGGPPSAIPLTRHNVVMETHRLCQPMQRDLRGNLIPVTLPDRVAQMYLDMVGDWRLSPLAGISTAPLLSADGSVRTADGYDPDTGLWCRSVPTLRLPSEPSRTDAEEALRRLRQSFRTFPFGDASRCWDPSLGVEVVDLARHLAGTRAPFLSTCRPPSVDQACRWHPGRFSQRQKYRVWAAERGCWSVRLP